MEIPCPSGLVFAARPWKLGDQTALLKARNKPMTMLPRTMVELAAESVIDPGPYQFPPGEPIDWNSVSHADILVANIMIRAGRDPQLALMPLCGQCRRLQRDAKVVDLLDLPVFMASEEGRAHLTSGAPIQRNYGGIVVDLRCTRGSDLNTLGKLQQEDEDSVLEVQTCIGISQVRTPAGEGIMDLPGIRKFWREQDWEFRDEIEKDLDTLFGGVDLTYKFTCDFISCQAEQIQTVPLDLAFYGLDLEKRLSARAKSSSVKKSVRELMRRASSRSSQGSPESQGST